MCRNIKPLFNFEPPVTEEEIRAAALQFARKISGFTCPSQANQAAFARAIAAVAAAAALLGALVTSVDPRALSGAPLATCRSVRLTGPAIFRHAGGVGVTLMCSRQQIPMACARLKYGQAGNFGAE
ncbi:MAG: DUF2277 domain-containing protein [Massilia sp.]|nr:DUF2277 domain-containing protein [Massilia sp.]